MRIGVDVGGTFTDLVALGGGRVITAKVPSTPQDQSEGVMRCVRSAQLDPGEVEAFAHGMTVATNALLERSGARTALVTTSGFRDVLEIGRQNRPCLYDLSADRPPALVPRDLRFTLDERMGPGGELEPLDEESLEAVLSDLREAEVEAVAVCLLFAFLHPEHERRAGERLRQELAGVRVSLSSEVLPEFREFERFSTTTADAYLAPKLTAYLARLAREVEAAGMPAPLVMQSTGGVVSPEDASRAAAACVVSGPAAGVVGATYAARASGLENLLTFDMGGTSTDVCLVQGRIPEPAAGRRAAGFPIRLPSLDIHTIGAGGGSIARIDAGGALVVGPESAGAEPGPACYGRGGTLPTVTDADLVLGRIPQGASFPGLGALDVDAARRALRQAGTTAEGVVAVVDAAMEQALRAVSVVRGVDPSDLALVAFGGAGPLHACALAEALGMAAVVVPPRAGVLSAVGLLCAPRQRDVVRSWPAAADHEGLAEALDELASRAAGLVGTEAEVTTSVDCRYAGQSHELTVPTVADFPDEHVRRNGYARPGAPIEVVALRATARTAPVVRPEQLGPVERGPAEGPCVVAEPDCTIWIPDGWTADVAADGSYVVTRT